MTPPTTYTSFLIRLWREQGSEWCPEPAEGRPESAVDWRGEVEHIQSGQRQCFDTLDETLDFVRRQARTETSPTDDTDTGSVKPYLINQSG